MKSGPKYHLPDLVMSGYDLLSLSLKSVLCLSEILRQARNDKRGDGGLSACSSMYELFRSQKIKIWRIRYVY